MKPVLFFLSGALFWINLIQAQDHKISLESQRTQLTIQPFSVIRVVDNRSNTSYIGWVQKGMANFRVDANFDGAFDQTILNFLNRNLNSPGPEIEVRINRLKISEETRITSESAYCELSIDFVWEKDSERYLVFSTSVTTEMKGAEVTAKHPANIANAFKICFQRLAQVDFSEAATFPVFSPENQPLAAGQPSANSLSLDQPLKNGLYDSFHALVHQSPAYTEGYFLEKIKRNYEPWQGTFEIHLKLEKALRNKVNVWGIVFDQKIYIYHQDELFPLEEDEKGRKFFYGYDVPSGESVMPAAILGGLVGATIATEAEKAQARKVRVKYTLNEQTGFFTSSRE